MNTQASETQPLRAPCLGRLENIYIKRDDLIHPIISGNKWRKLKFHLLEAERLNKKLLVTFGGGYSNHMVATACAAAAHGFKSACFVRGDELQAESNHFLQLAHLYGMQIIPVERSKYRDFKKELFEEYFGHKKEAYCIDEGGAGDLSSLGVEDIIGELPMVPDYIYHASATATTAVGLLSAIQKNPKFNATSVQSIAVLKNAEEQQLKTAHLGAGNSQIREGFEMGGYAKTNNELMEFVRTFIAETGILIDPIYTGKALWAIKKDIESGQLGEDKTVLFLHTGGMLGLFSKKMLGHWKP